MFLSLEQRCLFLLIMHGLYRSFLVCLWGYFTRRFQSGPYSLRKSPLPFIQNLGMKLSISKLAQNDSVEYSEFKKDKYNQKDYIGSK